MFEQLDFNSILKRQLIMVSGKGGTGKTTFAIFLAKLLAGMGKKVLLIHVNRLVEETWEKVYLSKHENLSQMNINSNNMFKEYIMLKLKSEALYNLFFEKLTALEVLRRAAPALNELLIIGKIYFECKQRNIFFQRKWDHVVVDLPSTGHALTILNIPSVVQKIFKKGIVAKETGRIMEIVYNRERSCVVLASLPEYMPTQETLKFIETANEKLDIAIGPIFLNKLPLEIPWMNSEEYKANIDKVPGQTKKILDNYQDRYNSMLEQKEYLETNAQNIVYTVPYVYGGISNPDFFHLMSSRLKEFMS